MSLRAMTAEQAKLVTSFVATHGKEARLRDLDAFRVKAKEGVSFILARAVKVKRGVFDFSKAVAAAEAVLAGKADPTGTAKKAKPVKAAKPKSAKASVKAKAKTVKKTAKAAVKATAKAAAKPKVAVTVAPVVTTTAAPVETTPSA